MLLTLWVERVLAKKKRKKRAKIGRDARGCLFIIFWVEWVLGPGAEDVRENPEAPYGRVALIYDSYTEREGGRIFRN